MKTATTMLATLALFLTLATAACTPCRDGTYSRSHGSGTCSHHGGVRK